MARMPPTGPHSCMEIASGPSWACLLCSDLELRVAPGVAPAHPVGTKHAQGGRKQRQSGLKRASTVDGRMIRENHRVAGGCVSEMIPQSKLLCRRIPTGLVLRPRREMLR